MKLIFKTRIQAAFRAACGLLVASALVVSCAKTNVELPEIASAPEVTESMAQGRSQQDATNAPLQAQQEGQALGFLDDVAERGSNKTIVEIAVGNPHFSALVAAVVKTGLAGALSNPQASLTVFAPTNNAFAQLPAPFNNAANIGAISDAAQIAFLKDVLLYHVLGAEVRSGQIASGSSSATTLKARGASNDNTVYISKAHGLIRLNGGTSVIAKNVNASNGVIHVINKVLFFPTQDIAQIAIGNPNFSTLVAALVKTNLAGVFTGAGDFTVFAPTNAAFAVLPAPFKNATSINAITDQATIDALANILKYHVVASRNFVWDLGYFRQITTLASAPNNKVTTFGCNNIGFVKGKSNPFFSTIHPTDILATNGVVQVIDRVLLP